VPVQHNPMRSKNPRRIAALIMVNVSPRWITPCAALGALHRVGAKCRLHHRRAALQPGRRKRRCTQREMARVAERIGCLARHVEELDVPIMAVESGSLDRLDVSDLRGKWIGLCGLYGGRFACVRESVRWLRARRIRVIQVRDAIVWPPGEKPSGSLGTVLFPGVYFPPWLNANIGV